MAGSEAPQLLTSSGDSSSAGADSEPMVEAGGHSKCATGMALFRCDGPADKYYGFAAHTVSHLRLGGRNASAARVAQRCAPDIPLDTAAGWRACAARSSGVYCFFSPAIGSLWEVRGVTSSARERRFDSRPLSCGKFKSQRFPTS